MSLRRKLFNPGKEGAARDFGLLVARVGFAGLLAYAHGWGKLERVLSGTFKFADPLGIGAPASLTLATFAEFLCAVALVLGFMSRLVALPLIFLFAVAISIHHAGDPLGEWEKALLFLLAFIALLFTGPGRFSLDAWLRRK